MSENFCVFVVDDDPFVRDVIRGILAPTCSVDCFASAEDCQAQMQSRHPGMLLLDVRMPGMDGYSFCRQIKDDPALRHIPVTFVSAQDTLEARLKGYEAGGEDFVVKPFEAEEILRKVLVAQQITEYQETLTRQLQDSELLSSLVMANMDEYAVLIRFIRELISWEDERQIADGILEMLRRYGLDGVVQTRISQRTLTVSGQGVDLPLETSVLNHVRGLDRIFEFRNRSVYNYSRLTTMISNMPMHDPDACGRLRDHLCIAVESAEARLRALETEEASHRSQAGIQSALAHLRAMTEALHQAHLHDRAASSDLFLRMEHGLANAFVHLGMSEDQERHLGNMVNTFMKELMDMLDRSEDTFHTLDKLGATLSSLASPAVTRDESENLG